MPKSDNQLKNDILEAAINYAHTEEACYLDSIKALVSRWEKRVSLNCVATRHAIAQFMERSGCQDVSSAEGTLKAMLAEAEEMELEERFKAIQLLNHDFREARYYKYNQWLLVVIGNAIITCHRASAKRWRKVAEDV